MAMKRVITALALLPLAALIAVSMALAAGSSSTSTRPAPPSDYDRAVRAVKAGDFRTAVNLLEQVVATDTGNADAYNYLGFSYRKLGRFEPALRYYKQALFIDPEHKGAHEYIGELYLQMDDAAKAKEHLARLDDICWLGCEEYDMLKAAIERYEGKQRG